MKNSPLASMEELHLAKSLYPIEDHEEAIRANGRTIRVLPIYRWLLANSE